MRSLPSIVPPQMPPAASGNGDWFAWLDYEAGQQAIEERQEREERFCPFDGQLPEGTYSLVDGKVKLPNGENVRDQPWYREWIERREEFPYKLVDGRYVPIDGKPEWHDADSLERRLRLTVGWNMARAGATPDQVTAEIKRRVRLQLAIDERANRRWQRDRRQKQLAEDRKRLGCLIDHFSVLGG